MAMYISNTSSGSAGSGPNSPARLKPKPWRLKQPKVGLTYILWAPMWVFFVYLGPQCGYDLCTLGPNVGSICTLGPQCGYCLYTFGPNVGILCVLRPSMRVSFMYFGPQRWVLCIYCWPPKKWAFSIYTRRIRQKAQLH